MLDTAVSWIADAPVSLLADAERAAALRRESRDWPSWDLSPQQICDLELLLTAAYAPLRGFMTRGDYESVCRSMRLASGAVWPVPIVLDVTPEVAAAAQAVGVLALRDPEGVMVAALHVEDCWTPDRLEEADCLFGTKSASHPGVAALLRNHPVYLGGRIEGVQLPPHHDYAALRRTSAEVRREIDSRGWTCAAAYQPSGPMHRAGVEATRRAAADCGAAHVLIQMLASRRAPADLEHHTRVRCLTAAAAAYPDDPALFSIAPYAERHPDAREIVLRAIVARACGCTHLLLDPGDLVRSHLLQDLAAELGIAPVPVREMIYLPERSCYVRAEEADGSSIASLSEEALQERLESGGAIPEWFTFPAVARELRIRHRPRSTQGFTVFFTGLSGSGKSTIANALLVKLLEIGGRPVTFLDGDLVRRHLSSELGFSKEHRDLNVRRIGYVASEIAKSGGVAICAPIAPYDATRQDVRRMIAPLGGFILVHVATPLEICEARDRKGLYARARAGCSSSSPASPTRTSRRPTPRS
jgi:sulfate adenylyltransferase